MKYKILIFTVFFTGLSISAFAQDAGQFAPGYIPEADWSKYEATETPPSNPYDKYKTIDISNEVNNHSQGNQVTSGINVSGADVPEKLSYHDIDLIQPQMDKTSGSFSFQYFSGAPDIKDSRGIFQQTFKNDPNAIDVGPVGFSFNKIWRRGLEFTSGANIAFRYLNGRGSFSSANDFSEAKFTLWAIPLEFMAGFNIPLGNVMKISFGAGPGVMGLMQTRSDMESGEKGKNRRQIGTGYFYSAEVKFNLSRFFPNWGFQFYRSYQAPMAFIGFNYKYSSYSNFQDELSVEGATIGASFGFEYL